MTFDIHGDTPSKFEELRDKRLPVAVRKIELLGNLGRTSYGATAREKGAVVYELEQAVAALREAYRLPSATIGLDFASTAAPIPVGKAEGGSSFESEVRWAVDAISRGDTDLALDRLKRCLTS